jgi:hypothetical protein
LNQKRKDDLYRGAVRTLGYALICLPIFASFLYVGAFGVNVPVTDTWVMAPLFDKLFSGELTVGNLWAQHSEHRPLLPRIFLLLMGPLTDFNVVTIMYATQLCLLATFVCVFLAYRDTVGLDTKSLFFAVPVSLLVFTLGQYWNMLYAWSLHVVVVVSFGALSFLLLNKLREKGVRTTIFLFLASVVSGSAATLSAGHGLLVWPVGLMQLCLEPILVRRKRYLLTVWTLIGIAHWTIYFWGFKAPAGRMSNTYFFDSSTLGVDYFMGLIGSALFQESVLAVATGLVIGTILVLVIFWIWRNREQNRYTFWISLSTFSLLILAATAVARSGRGLDASIGSKYVTFSVLLAISVYVMSLRLARDHSGLEFSALPLGVCAGLIILSVPLSYYSGVEIGEAIKVKRERAAYILFTYKHRTNTCLEQAVNPHFWGPHNSIKNETAIFENLDYTVFSEPPSEVLFAGSLPGTHCKT